MTSATEKPLVTVRYRKAWSISMVVLGAINIALALMTAGAMAGFTGCIVLTVGIVHLINPAYVLLSDAFLLKNGFGMTVKRHAFDSLADLSWSPDRKRLKIVDTTGVKREVKVPRWLFDPNDMKTLESAVDAGVFE